MSHLNLSGKSSKSFYKLEEVTCMLPLLTRICSDMEHNMFEMNQLMNNLDGDSEEYVEFALRLKADYHQDIKEELEQLSAKVCHAKYGFIDIPVWHTYHNKVVNVCISKKSQAGKLKAHWAHENARFRTFFWSL